MDIINIAEAKSHLSKLIDMALKGKEIIIGKRNVPLVKLSVINPLQKEKRKGGQLKGKIYISSDFNSLPDDIQSSFDGLQT